MGGYGGKRKRGVSFVERNIVKGETPRGCCLLEGKDRGARP